MTRYKEKAETEPKYKEKAEPKHKNSGKQIGKN